MRSSSSNTELNGRGEYVIYLGRIDYCSGGFYLLLAFLKEVKKPKTPSWEIASYFVTEALIVQRI